MAPEPVGADQAVAIFRLQESLNVGLERIHGQLALLVQRADQQDNRAAERDAEMRALEAKVAVLEAALAEVRRQAVTRDDLDRDHQKLFRWLTLIVSLIAIAAGAGTSVLIAVLT
jgi:hypothetical protein